MLPSARRRFRVVCLLASALPFAAFAAEDAPPGANPAFVDPSVKPGDNFFQYANGAWIKTATIPNDRSSWGSFSEMQERNETILHGILEECAKGSGNSDAALPPGLAARVGTMYRTGMDAAAINEARLSPLLPWLDAIDKLADRKELPAVIAKLHGIDATAPFTISGEQDEKDSVAQIAIVYQDGLGLPNKEYYTRDDEKSRSLREDYERHVAIMFLLKGDNPAEAARKAGVVLRFENELAKASRTPVELRDPESNYHKLSLADLAAQAPGFGWAAYFEAVGLKEPGAINVCQPDFCRRVGTLAAEAPLDEWKIYLTWHALHAAAPYLSSDFENENFRFFRGTLAGVKEPEPRWKRVLHAVDDGVGMDLAQIFVAKHFTPTAKKRALELVGDLKESLRERLNAVDWMSADTRAAALRKLDAFGVKIGYPDKWRDYSALEIKEQPYALNVFACKAFDLKRRLARVGQPVDPNEWGMTPPTINAYYSPNRNEIVFPAGILQPPFFNEAADDASNYGSIGVVIGHEMTHGFDDQGRQYDPQGNLKNWWTDEDLKRFTERGEKIIAQFDGYEVEKDLHINGKLTEGENIADLGGLKIAYRAFQKARERQAAADRDRQIGGMNPVQRFFLSYGQTWRTIQRPAAMRLQVLSNPHSPAAWRVIGPVSNLPEFSEAFGIAPGSAEVQPEAKRVNIW